MQPSTGSKSVRSTLRPTRRLPQGGTNMPVPGVEVAGTGLYVPEQIVTNQDYEERYSVSADWILQVSGIKTRRVAARSQACTDLAIPAAERALAKARMTADELDLVILATIQADYTTPPG